MAKTDSQMKARLSPTNRYQTQQPQRDVMNIPLFDEDDEDLRQQISQLDRQEAREKLDPEVRK